MKEATGQEPIKSIKEIIYQIVRNYVKKLLTNNLGKVVETEDKLICYVKKRKCPKGKYICDIVCSGIRERDKQIATLYNLDKPICYIFDKIDFGGKKTYKQVNINGYNNCEVIIKDCKFWNPVNIRVDGTCTIENTYIKSFHNLSIGADDLIIKDMNITNYFNTTSDLNIILGSTNTLDIINSSIGKEKDRTNTSILSDTINLVNSKIAGDEVCCKASNIISDTSSQITASTKADLKVNDLQELNINSPSINYNDKSLITESESISLEKVEDQLGLKRLELIELLKSLKGNVDNKNEATINKCKSSLESKPISRVLSKKH